MAADVALVARPPQPISAASPASSSAVTPSTPMRETGSWAPTMAQPMPSSTRCLARSRTEAGTSSSVVWATQVQAGQSGRRGPRRDAPDSLCPCGCRVRPWHSSPPIDRACLARHERTRFSLTAVDVSFTYCHRVPGRRSSGPVARRASVLPPGVTWPVSVFLAGKHGAPAWPTVSGAAAGGRWDCRSSG